MREMKVNLLFCALASMALDLGMCPPLPLWLVKSTEAEIIGVCEMSVPTGGVSGGTVVKPTFREFALVRFGVFYALGYNFPGFYLTKS